MRDNHLEVCPDCNRGVDDYYMVKDKVWDEHGCGHGQMHMECLSKRMGRPLSIDDFTDAVVNMKFKQGYLAALIWVDWWETNHDYIN